MRSGLDRMFSTKDSGDFYKDLERALLRADVGTKATAWTKDKVRELAGPDPSLSDLGKAVKTSIAELLCNIEAAGPVQWRTTPHVVLILGTNGGGKTTTVAKLARKASEENKNVILAAGDTYRAAATEQLETLAGSLGPNVRVVTGDKDPGAIAYNAVSSAIGAKADLVIVDTAGRQPSSTALMAEATKINKAIGKAMPGAPHERVLALDANTGQNALHQAEAFDKHVGLTSCVLTKLDGSARGGVILAMALQHPLAVRYIGVGEKTSDLIEFNKQDFVDALFSCVK